MSGRDSQESADPEHQDQDAEPTTKAPDDAAPDVPTQGGSDSGDQ